MIRPKAVALMLGVSEQTLARWRVEGGKLPYSRLGRAVVYDLADIEAFVSARKRTSTSEFTDPASPRDA
jgi:predicted DNA-binding transcriptional regulator AlpA